MNMFMYSINYLLVKMFGMVLSIKILKLFVADTEQVICQEMSILIEYMGESNCLAKASYIYHCTKYQNYLNSDNATL